MYISKNSRVGSEVSTNEKNSRLHLYWRVNILVFIEQVNPHISEWFFVKNNISMIKFWNGGKKGKTINR